MNRDKFIEYINNPEKLDSSNLQPIREVLHEYPWFQTGHMLLLKTLGNISDIKFNKQLKFSAAHVGNRHILYHLLHKEKVSVNGTDKSRPPEVEDPPVSDSLADRVFKDIEELRKTREESTEPEGQQENITFKSIDPGTDVAPGQEILTIDEKAAADIEEMPVTAGLEEKSVKAENRDPELLELDNADAGHHPDTAQTDPADHGPDEKKNLFKEVGPDSESHSFAEWLDMLTPVSTTSGDLAPVGAGTGEGDYRPVDENKVDSRPGGFDLIDRFLIEKPRIEPRSPLDTAFSSDDMSAESVKENEEFFTETLAKIYVQQKHYRKAILAYEKLCLKYPEKYSYFADQIDEIRRFINH